MIEPLATRAWRMYRTTHDACVVRPSIPILYFGDSQRYQDSPRKVITVALNPSRREFPSGDRFRRFPSAEGLKCAVPDARSRSSYLAALDNYFRICPYRSWFGWFEQVLQGLEASYYDGEENGALHTDLCSPLATDPTWSRLGNQRIRLEINGIALWHELANYLSPDVIVISVARHYRDRIAFTRSDNWQPLVAIPRNDPVKRPYQAWVQRSTLRSGKETLLVFGQAAQQPFATLSIEARQRVGKAVREVLDAG